MRLFEVFNEDRGNIFVVAADADAARMAFESWAATSPDAPPLVTEHPTTVRLLAADTAIDDPSGRWATLIV